MLCMIIRSWSVWIAITFLPDVSHDCMLSLFVMVASFWMVFREYKTELFWFLSPTEGTNIAVDLIADGVWGADYELTGAFSEKN